MSDHDTSLFPTTGPTRRPQWFAACSVCGWTGDPHPNPSTAANDAAGHLKLNAPKGKD